jgi:hypothetical protein
VEHRRRVLKVSNLLLASVVLVGLSVPARAATKVEGQVPFGFMVGSTELPAGHYEIEPSSSEDVLIVRNADTGKEIIADYITRIASREDGKSTLVFDVLGGQHILSEIHMAGSDGYLLAAAARKPHTHEQVKAN